jgi:hypothetical protein
MPAACLAFLQIGLLYLTCPRFPAPTRWQKTNFGPLVKLQELYNKVRRVQVGDEADNHGWGRVVM